MKELKKDRTEERKERSKKGRQKERKKCREFVNGCITKQINEPRCLCDEIARERTTASVEYAPTDGCALYRITTRCSLPGLTVNASHKSFILLKCMYFVQQLISMDSPFASTAIAKTWLPFFPPLSWQRLWRPWIPGRGCLIALSMIITTPVCTPCSTSRSVTVKLFTCQP